MKKIEAIIVADSVHKGSRITTFLLTYPRMIHAELMTHRVFSRNSASSRAIPFKKMVQSVKEDPFIPIAWQKEHTGMQGTEYYTNPDSIKQLRELWIEGAGCAIEIATALNSKSVIDLDCPEKDGGVTKQLCNRLLEPFLWHTVLVTTTQLANFFELRCPQYLIGGFRSKKDANNFAPDLLPMGIHDEKDALWWIMASTSQAEIHIQALAEAMWDAYKASTPKELELGEWHIPYGDKIDLNKLGTTIRGLNPEKNFPIYAFDKPEWKKLWEETKLKISVARAARLSYMTMDGVVDYEKDIKLYDRLLESKHLSPFEHCAKAVSSYAPIEVTEGATHEDRQGNLWSGNFKGWVQYRQLIQQREE